MNKQIEEMARTLCGEKNACEACVSFDMCEFRTEASVLCNADYRKQSDWISVEERLPEDDETVLVITSESEMEVCFYKTESKGIFQRLGGLVLIYNVTHWMPLPEAPKMKGGE